MFNLNCKHCNKVLNNGELAIIYNGIVCASCSMRYALKGLNKIENLMENLIDKK